MGAQFLLSGNDHNYLMAGASARAEFLRGLKVEAAPAKKARKKS